MRPNPQEIADLVIFTEEILNGKLHFLWSTSSKFILLILKEDVFAIQSIFFHNYVKSVRFRSFSCPYFLAFGLNTERYGVSLRFQSECWKIRTRKIPNTDTFHAVHILNIPLSSDRQLG